MEQIRQKAHYFWRLFIPVIGITLLVALFIGYLTAQIHLEKLLLTATDAIQQERSLFRKTLTTNASDVYMLKDEVLHDATFHDFLLAHLSKVSQKNIDHLADKFFSFAERRTDYDQVRLLDQNGQEIIRINHRDHRILSVPKDQLQNKQHRYYFKETKVLKNEQIFFSPLDLNIEYNKVERPFVPTIRVATPLYINQVFCGMIVLNYNAREFINQLKKITRHLPSTLYLIDPQGYILSGPNPSQEWGNSLVERQQESIKNIYPSIWKAYNNNRVSQKLYSENGLVLIDNLSANIKELTHSQLTLTLLLIFPWSTVIPSALSLQILTFLLLSGLLALLSWLWATMQYKQIEHTKIIENLAATDTLTKIANRHQTIAELARQIATAKRYGIAFSLIMLDLDRFKNINDTYGHLKGDETLISFVETCKKQIRTSDLIGRVGGEEFFIILPHTKLKEAMQVAEKIRETVTQMRVPVEDTTFHITTSCGVTEWTPADDVIETIMSRVDKALYQAKEEGRDRVISR